jgi:hypothetical protein
MALILPATQLLDTHTTTQRCGATAVHRQHLRFGQELGQERLTGPLLADASRGGAAERSLSCGSAWSV